MGKDKEAFWEWAFKNAPHSDYFRGGEEEAEFEKEKFPLFKVGWDSAKQDDNKYFKQLFNEINLLKRREKK